MIGGHPVQILNILQESGYEAYYVGGCVRDYLLGRPIHDWDITTSALPEQTMSCFTHCVPTGIRHGTITVFLDQMQAEVTTYRTDGDYVDGRHPEQVVFVRNLEEDLSRRDFTINAMAMSSDGEITDLYDGRYDLAMGLIRCVGEPEKRFREDALRMLRAFRFSAQLNFTIEKETLKAITVCAPLCRDLSVERVRDELEKTLLSDHPERIREMAILGLLFCCESNIDADCRWIAKLPKDRSIRWAALCRVWPSLNLSHIRLDKRTAQNATIAGRCSCPTDRLGWKQLIFEQGMERARITAALEGASSVVDEIFLSGECLNLQDLAVKGSDFPDLRGSEIGAKLKKLMFHVLECPEDNIKEKLLEI